MDNKEFVNGFYSWRDTFYEVCRKVEMETRIGNPKMRTLQYDKGHCGFYDLATELTDEFEEKNKGRIWDGEFYDEIDEFLEWKLKK